MNDDAKIKRTGLYYKSGYKYQLDRDYTILTPLRPAEDISTDYIKLDKSGRMTIVRGYAWDGASGPTIDTDSTMAGSVMHDAGYQLIRMKCLPQSARAILDKFMQEIMIEEGMWKFRAEYFFEGVHHFGGFSTRKPKEVHFLAAGFQGILFRKKKAPRMDKGL